MAEQNENQLAQQANQPYHKKEGLQDANQPGKDIVKGARDESQLNKIKQHVPEGGREAYPERQAGAPANTSLNNGDGTDNTPSH
jgi:hypothetical protein